MRASASQKPWRTARRAAALPGVLQTMKNWLRARPVQPTALPELQALLDRFTDEYNQHRPHRSLPQRATPATAYAARPKTGPSADHDTHDRVRTDKIDQTGCVTLRLAGRLHHIGVGRTHTGTHLVLLVQDLHVCIIHAATGELLRGSPSTPPATTSQPAAHRPPIPETTNARTHNP